MKAISTFVACYWIWSCAVAVGGPTPTTLPAQSVQSPHVLHRTIEVTLTYLIYTPPGYTKDASKRWPLLLFLHGSGERGTNTNQIKVHGPPKLVETQPDSALAKEFIVLSPQCLPGENWDAETLNALLDEVIGDYRVDVDRVYLTGMSMGGNGTWNLSARYPERFAAIAPMCGGGDKASAPRYKNMAVWAFHGDADTTVPVRRSEIMVDALKKLNIEVKFTKYPGVGHDCWTQSYANPELYTWLLSHSRPKNTTAK